MIEEQDDALPGPTSEEATLLARALNERGYLVLAAEDAWAIGESGVMSVLGLGCERVTMGTIMSETTAEDFSEQCKITCPDKPIGEWEKYFYRVRID